MYLPERDLLINAVLRGDVTLPTVMLNASPFGDPDVFAVRVLHDLHQGADLYETADRLDLAVDVNPDHTLLKLMRLMVAIDNRQAVDGWLAQMATDAMRRNLTGAYHAAGLDLPEWHRVAA